MNRHFCLQHLAWNWLSCSHVGRLLYESLEVTSSECGAMNVMMRTISRQLDRHQAHNKHRIP